MKTTVSKIRLTLLMLITCLLSVHVSVAQNCGPNKVLVCHKGKNTLCISKNALQAHLNHGDYLGPCQTTCAVTATGGTLTCTASTVTLSATATVAGVTFSWTGPGGFTSTAQNPTATTAGTYTVTITGQGCSASDTALVKTNTTAPGVIATGGTLSCSSTSITISASSITGATFSWTGPAGFTSSVQNPTVNLPGIYTVKATNPANGCTSTDTANVQQSGVVPGATASASGTLTCTTTTVTLTGTSPTAGTTFRWTGPNGFLATTQNTSTTVPGVYTLTVTNPANGCVSTDTATVLQNSTPPGATATASGTLTCTITTITLNGSSPTPGATFSWTGPNGFTAATQNTTTTASGIYTLTVTNPVNGCVSSDTATVRQNVVLPGATASAPVPLTCTVTSVTLTGASSATGVTFSWVGPGGFSSGVQNPVATVAGIYTLTVTNPANGCVSTDTATVRQNGVVPGATATASGALTCISDTITLNGISPTPGVTFSWTGPGGFTSAIQNPITTTPGIYTLTVTNPVNGCQSTDTAAVVQNILVPGATATATAVLTCTNTSVTLSGTSSTSGVLFRWTGPNGFVSLVQNPLTTTPGLYTLTVINPANGCVSTDTATVVQNSTLPGATATASGLLTCINGSVSLSGVSSTTGVTFAWSGPGGFTSVVQNPIVTVPGVYTVTVTNPVNGCVSTDTANVIQNTAVPACSLIHSSADSTISTAVTPGTTYVWSVAGAGWSIVSGQGTTTIEYTPGVVGSQGVFTLVATTTATGCINVCNIIVQNTGIPIPRKSDHAREIQAPTHNDTENNLKLDEYPNPSNGKSIIEFMSPVNDYIQVDVFDFTGSKISTIYHGNVEAGKTYQAIFTGETHPSGTYYYKLITRKKIYVGKFILTH
jgi:hypothetical protein